jgi:hypothetical protein
MLKKIGLPIMALAAVLAVAPCQAKADPPCPPPPTPDSTCPDQDGAYVYANPTFVGGEHRHDERHEHARREHDRDRRDR